MKTNLLKSIVLIAFASTVFCSCTNSDRPYNDASTPIKTYELTTTTTADAVIAAATTTPIAYPNDDIIEAYVTSNDAAGNFYKSISFQTMPTDGSAPKGFSVSVDKTMLFVNGFTPGRKVYIKLHGLINGAPAQLATGIVYGSMQIGVLVPGDANATPPVLPTITGISEVDFQNFLFPSATIVNENTLVRHMSLAAANTDANQNTLVEVDNVQFANSSLGRTYFDINSGGYATNQIIEDPIVGTSSVCRISQYAPFSVHKIPAGRGSIRGVMTKYSSTFQYMVRNESDFKLTGSRYIPVLFDDFSNGLTAWNAYSVTGAQVWSVDAAHGNAAPSATMSGYSSGNKANEDWLISPTLDLSSFTSATLTFDSAYNFSGTPLAVLISTNYSGTGSPTAATWTVLPATLSVGGYAWLSSGPVNISSSYTGAGNNNVHVAFKYISTTSAASTWELDNVKIIGN